MTYEPLRTPTSTRLLTIHPGTSSGPPVLSLQQVDLADGHPFEAISYVWGEPTLKKYIVLGNEKVLVWHNLWILLQRLRLPDKPRIVWIDALCIAQENLNEKAHQVAIIDEIFKYATHVIAWVGPHDNDSEMIFHRPPLPKANVEFREVPESKTSGFGGAWRKSIGLNKAHYEKRWQQKHEYKVAVEQHHIANRHLWRWSNAVLAFSRREYFMRQWIVQELAVAQELRVYCGEDSEDWSKLMEMFKYLHQLAQIADIELPSHTGPLWREPADEKGQRTRLPTTPEKSLTDLYTLDKARSNYQKHKRTDLFTLFRLFERKLCANAVDHVYAVLSLEKRNADQRPLRIDYTIDVVDLTIQVIVERHSHIKTYQDIDALMNLFALDAYQEMKVQLDLWDRTKYYGPGSIPIQFYNNCTRSENQYIRKNRISDKLQGWLSAKADDKLSRWAVEKSERTLRSIYARDKGLRDHKYGRVWAVMERKWKAKERLQSERVVGDDEDAA